MTTPRHVGARARRPTNSSNTPAVTPRPAGDVALAPDSLEARVAALEAALTKQLALNEAHERAWRALISRVEAIDYASTRGVAGPSPPVRYPLRTNTIS